MSDTYRFPKLKDANFLKSSMTDYSELFKVISEAFSSKKTQKKDSSMLGYAFEDFKAKKYKEAAGKLSKAMEETNCKPCRKKIATVEADMLHLATICELDAGECREEEKRVEKKFRFLKDNYVPIAEDLREKAEEYEKYV